MAEHLTLEWSAIDLAHNHKMKNHTMVGGSVMRQSNISLSHLPERPEIDLSFTNISYSVICKNETKRILRKLNGEFKHGTLNAIMGASGAGKSSLMNILVGTTRSGVSGDICINGMKRDSSFHKKCAYIPQIDYHLPYLTVEESVYIATQLKIDVKYNRRKEIVSEVLSALSLSQHARTRCHSLSGGQLKRLSMALELVNNPSLMFFDEPTSGLDSVSSYQCINLLKMLAGGGRTIVCTIHQPSARLFEVFDTLYFLSEGSCLYNGRIESLVPYLAILDLQCPPYHNPSDYITEIASLQYGTESRQRLLTAVQNGKCRQFHNRFCQLKHSNSLPIPPTSYSSSNSISSQSQQQQQQQQQEENEQENEEINELQQQQQQQQENELQQIEEQEQEQQQQEQQQQEQQQEEQQENELQRIKQEQQQENEEEKKREEEKLFGNLKELTTEIIVDDHNSFNNNNDDDNHDHTMGSEKKYKCLIMKSGQFATSATWQFVVIFHRSIRGILRNSSICKLQLLCHVLIGLLIGLLYLSIGNKATHVFNNTSCIFFSLLFCMFAGMMPTLMTFPSEVRVFLRETMNSWYSLRSYFFARTFADLPLQVLLPIVYMSTVYWMTDQPNDFTRFVMILTLAVLTSLIAQAFGVFLSIVTEPGVAVFAGPVSTIPILLFSGYFLPFKSMPIWLSWLSYFSYIRFAFEGSLIAIYGYGRVRLGCEGYCPFENAERILEMFEVNNVDYWRHFIILCSFYVGARMSVYFALRWKCGRMDS
ncbi:hypothetical protein SNEBB_008557 [Seison nebaliae]|nr:hypothetical protein SNEBB_008557 [Seison nebaliae]